MANITRRQGEPHELGLARGWDPRSLMADPFRMIRELMGADVLGGAMPTAAAVFAPDIEVRETKDAFEITADLPGVNEEDIEIDVSGRRMTLTGRRVAERRDEGDRYFAYERTYGTFSRTLTLPEGVDMDSVRADLKNGVLEITVPKRAEVQGRRVQIGAGGGAGEAAKEGREGRVTRIGGEKAEGGQQAEEPKAEGGQRAEKKAA